MNFINSIADYFIRWWAEAPEDVLTVAVGTALILMCLNKKVRRMFF